MLVIKRDMRRVPFDTGVLARSVGYAGKASRGEGSDLDTDERTHEFADKVAIAVTKALAWQPIVTTGQIAAEVLRVLSRRSLDGGDNELYDEHAWLRYSSAVKGHSEPLHYAAEALALDARRGATAD